MLGQESEQNFDIFDVQVVCREFGISPEEFMVLKDEIRADFPDDDLLFELHLIRAMRARGISKSDL